MAKVLMEEGYEVSVLTVLPNYPTGKIFPEYKNRLFIQEEIEGMKVYRLAVIPSNSKLIFPRMASMATHAGLLFTVGWSKLIKVHPDLIIVNTPSIINGFSGSLIAEWSKTKILLNISDLYPITAQVLGVLKFGHRYRFLEWLERRMYKRAHAFLCQSQEIVDHIAPFNTEGRPVMLYRNLHDTHTDWKTKKPSEKIKIVYTGLLGVAQGVLGICEHINFSKLNVEFHIYGQGPEEKAIEKFALQHPDRGLFPHGNVSEAKIPEILSNADAMIIPLTQYLPGAFPSKVYLAMSNGVPSLFLGSGEAAQLIIDHDLGWVCQPQSYEQLEKQIQKLTQLSFEERWAWRKKIVAVQQQHFNKNHQDTSFLNFVKNLI